MIYCVSDIHGDFIRYQTMLKMINFSSDDTLYVLGDVIDRGTESMRILFDMMSRDNVIPIAGNHEYMALQCLSWLNQEITEETLKNLSQEKLEELQI